MSAQSQSNLSRRERQILDILYQRDKATAAEVQEALADGPGYSAVRALLRIMEEKGHVRHHADGARYVYQPAAPRERVRRPALSHLVATYFSGSVEQAVAALLDGSAGRLSDQELDRLASLIEQAKRGKQ